MAAKRPHDTAPARSRGFNLDALGSDPASLFSQYSTVQVKNGSQSFLLSRAADAGTSGYLASILAAAGLSAGSVQAAGSPAVPIGGSDAPTIPTTINQNGVVRLQGEQEQLTLTKRAADVAAAVKKAKGGWSGLPAAAKVGIIGGGAAVVLIGAALVIFRPRS